MRMIEKMRTDETERILFFLWVSPDLFFIFFRICFVHTIFIHTCRLTGVLCLTMFHYII